MLVVHSLEAGGAQRVVATMANHWAERKWQVCVVTLEKESEDFFPLDSRVRRVALDQVGDSTSLFSGLLANRRRIASLRRAIGQLQPELVVSFVDQTNVLTLLATKPLAIPTIVTERTDPRHHRLSTVWSRLRKWTYPRAAAVVVQTEAVCKVVQTLTPRANVLVIANGISAPPASEQVQREKIVVGMGRLSVEKGFDLLIRAWGQVATQHPAWSLRIYGDGPQRDALRELAAQEAAGQVELAGPTDCPERVYREASIFALPSRYEGFPNALLEAMAHGVPAVAFSCQSGPSEIVRSGVDGLLVPPTDVAQLAESLARLMDDDALRQQLGTRAREVTERFSLHRFYAAWESLIEHCIQSHGEAR